MNAMLQRSLSGQAPGYCFMPSLGPGTVSILGPFEGGYKWLLLACGPVWVGTKVALVTYGMSVLLPRYV